MRIISHLTLNFVVVRSHRLDWYFHATLIAVADLYWVIAS